MGARGEFENVGQAGVIQRVLGVQRGKQAARVGKKRVVNRGRVIATTTKKSRLLQSEKLLVVKSTSVVVTKDNGRQRSETDDVGSPDKSGDLPSSTKLTEVMTTTTISTAEQGGLKFLELVLNPDEGVEARIHPPKWTCRGSAESRGENEWYKGDAVDRLWNGGEGRGIPSGLIKRARGEEDGEGDGGDGDNGGDGGDGGDGLEDSGDNAGRDNFLNELPKPDSWSFDEKARFPQLLKYLGSDWRGIADWMKSKSPTMVKNYYNYMVGRGATEWSIVTMQADAIRRSHGAWELPPLSIPLPWSPWSPEEEDTFWELLHGLYTDQPETINWEKIFYKVRHANMEMSYSLEYNVGRLYREKDEIGRTRYEEWKRKKIVRGAGRESFNLLDQILSKPHQIGYDTWFPESLEEMELLNNPWG